MKKTIPIAFAALALLLASCTETDRAQKDRLFSDTPASLTCFDFGIPVFQGRSKGKPQRDDTGDGMWTFVDATTGKYTTVEGNCVIAYD